MARQIENALTIVDLDGKNAKAELEKLEKKAHELKTELKELRKQPLTDPKLIKQVEVEYSKVRKELNKTKRETVDVSAVMNNLSGTSLNKLEQAYRKVRLARKSIAQDDPQFKKLIATEKQLKAQIDKSNGSLRQQKSLLSSIGDGFNKWSGMIMAAAATFTGAVLSIRKASELADIREEKTDYLQALTGLSPEAVAEMEQMAIKTSTSVVEGNIRIKQSADDIVDAYTLVGSQRPELLKNADALHAVTQDAIILSEAAKMELDPAARALANTLNQFNLSADQSRRVINILAAGSQAGSADIEYLSQAIEKTGTTANLMGMQVEQTVGALEAIAPYYKEASMAGNSFDKVLLKLKAQQIGYKDGVFDLNAAVLQLEAMFNSGTSAVDIFGVEHAKMAELLVLNKDQIINYTQAVTGTEKAMEQAAINTDNNAAKLAQAKNKAKEFAIELGKKLQPALTGIVSKGALMLKALSALVDLFIKYKAVLIPMTTAVLAYLAATKAQAMFEKLNASNTLIATAAKKAYNAIITVLRLNLKKATIEQEALNKAGKANVWGLVAAGITAAATYLIQYVNKMREASSAAKAVQKMTAETTSEFGQQRAQLEKLLVTAKDNNLSLAERKAAIKEINAISPEYLGNITLENLNTAATTASINKYVEALQNKAREQALNNLSSEKYAKIMEIEVKATKEYWDSQSKTWQYSQGSFTNYSNKLIKEKNTLLKEIEDLMAMFNKFAYTTAKALDPDIQAKITAIEEAWQIAGDPVNSTLEERNAALATLNTLLDGHIDALTLESVLWSGTSTAIKSYIDELKYAGEASETPIGTTKEINGVTYKWDGKEWVLLKVPDPPDPPDSPEDETKKLWAYEQYQDSMVENLGKDWAIYLQTRKSDDQTYYDWKAENDKLHNEQLYKTAIEANEIAKQQQLDILRQQYASGEISAQEYESSKLLITIASLENEKALRIAYSKEYYDIERQLIDMRLDLERKAFEQREKIANKMAEKQKALNEKEIEEYKAKTKKYADLASEMGEAVGKIMGDNSKTAVEKQKEVAKELLKITLQSLRNTLQAMIFEAMAREVGSKGFIGLGTGAALSAALGIAYGVATSAIEGFESGGFTGVGARNQVAGIVHKREFVVNADGTQNPTLNPILHLINDLAANNRLANFDFNTLFSMPGLISGGFASEARSVSGVEPQQPVIASVAQQPVNINLPPIFYQTLKSLNDKISNIEATISYDKQKIADSKIESAKNKARLLG